MTIEIKKRGKDIGCRLVKTGNQSINDSIWTNIQWDSVDYDSDNMVDLVSDNTKIIIKTTGKYLVVAAGRFANSVVGFRGYGVRKNVDTVHGETFYQSAFGMSGTSTAILQLEVDDYLQFRAYQNTGAPLDFRFENPSFEVQKIDIGG